MPHSANAELASLSLALSALLATRKRTPQAARRSASRMDRALEEIAEARTMSKAPNRAAVAAEASERLERGCRMCGLCKGR